MTATVHPRQCVLDVALQYFGSIEAAYIVADRLDASIDQTLTAGATFEYSPDEIIDPSVVNYYKNNNIIPTNNGTDY